MLKNRLISSLRVVYYWLREPLQLKIERFRHRTEYFEKNPLITVYTATYNRAQILMERAMKSVLVQTYKNFEYIIIGDGCTDDTFHLINQINDKRIRFINIRREKNYPNTPQNKWFAGSVAPSNLALYLAEGKWIARIDDDDTWTEDHLEKLLRFAQVNDYEFVTSKYEEERNNTKKAIEGMWLESPYYYPKRKNIDIKSPKTGAHSGFLFRSYLGFIKYNRDCWRKSWNKVSDCDLYMRMYQASVRMGYLEEVLTFVYPRPNETTVGLEAYLELEKKELDKKR